MRKLLNIHLRFGKAALAATLLLWSATLIAPPNGGSQPLLHELPQIPVLAVSLAVPNPALKPISQIKAWNCVAGWYGEQFDGQPTANGEVYDMYAETAAHPWLPLGSIVRVINPRTRRSDVVRINDRGPFVAGRDLDVSFAVAQKLGFADNGVAHVRVELLEVPKRFILPHAKD
jgi:rare lipoprotein A